MTKAERDAMRARLDKWLSKDSIRDDRSEFLMEKELGTLALKDLPAALKEIDRLEALLKRSLKALRELEVAEFRNVRMSLVNECLSILRDYAAGKESDD